MKVEEHGRSMMKVDESGWNGWSGWNELRGWKWMVVDENGLTCMKTMKVDEDIQEQSSFTKVLCVVRNRIVLISLEGFIKCTNIPEYFWKISLDFTKKSYWVPTLSWLQPYPHHAQLTQ